jgi:hypothetical protein
MIFLRVAERIETERLAGVKALFFVTVALVVAVAYMAG